LKIIDRLFADPELCDAPPVLVDVGAAGGVHPAWRRIARYSIGVGFEPDARETAPLDAAQREFQKWVFCPTLVVPVVPPEGRALLHLTRSPQCSSTLRPRADALKAWAFAEFFEVIETRSLPAATLLDALRAQGIGRIDWLKCDTQGLDLKIFLSLPAATRARLLAVEFEPGFIDAYEGEDKVADVLAAMAREPFWLAAMDVGHTPRSGPAAMVAHWVRRLAPGAPAWANLCYLRDPFAAAEPMDRRGHLLTWVFATLCGQPGHALAIAEAGARQFGGGLFEAMGTASARNLRWAMLRNAPAALWRRLRRA
jgi:hypothetical protein